MTIDERRMSGCGKMKIMIIGGGSLGMLYAARLALANEDVMLLVRTDEQAEAISQQGLHYKHVSGDETTIAVRTMATERYLQELESESESNANSNSEREAQAKESFAPDWILLALKQPQVAETRAETWRRLARGGVPLLALQNGIGHMEILRQAVPGSLINAAITTEGAMRIDSRSVVHTGIGKLTFGNWAEGWENDDERQKMLSYALCRAGIQANLSNDMGSQVYLKLLLNAVINPLTAIFHIKNGELPRDPARLRWMRALHHESAGILRAAGLRQVDGLWEQLLAVCASTAANESSMLRDVRAGRPTEIRWINGGIARLARERGMPSPMNDAAIAFIEALYDS